MELVSIAENKPAVSSFEDNSIIYLSDVRRNFNDGIISENEVISLYQEWVNTPYYMILYRPNRSYTVEIPSYKNRMRNGYECFYKAIKLSKRGNDVYRSKLRYRFKELFDLISNSKDYKFLDLNKKYDSSNLLFITLTYDSKLCDKSKSWRNIGNELNLFLSNLKKRYGSIQVLRCFEAFKTNGYPHIHLIIHFNQFFPVFRYRNKKGKMSFRLDNKYLDILRGFWHSYIMVEGVRDMGAVGYLLKYITKDMYVTDSYYTVAHLWLYRKQSYSMSSKFVYSISCDVKVLPISLLDSYRHNSNHELNEWYFCCTVKASFEHKNWNFDISNMVDIVEIDKIRENNPEISFSQIFSKYV
jgi:hypothetical protein